MFAFPMVAGSLMSSIYVQTSLNILIIILLNFRLNIAYELHVKYKFPRGACAFVRMQYKLSI